ncbi:MAG: hypothetical protein ISS19_13055 [Bacteroidales bacterium]|nr:hypothetical protein [Bacteroidales bacterium]
MKYISSKLTRKQCIDAGMAVVLIMLLIGLFTDKVLFYKLAIPILVINMIAPRFYYPFGIVWFGFSGLLGDVVSRILLTIVYFIIVFPVGIIRRLSGKDTLKLKEFKRSANSVMLTRDHTFTKTDLEKPF